MNSLKIWMLLLLTGIFLLSAESLFGQTANPDSLAKTKVRTKKHDRKRPKVVYFTKKEIAYDRLVKNKQVRSVRSGGLAFHLIDDQLYLEMPDSLLERKMMITTRIERTGDAGDGLVGQHPIPPYVVKFSNGAIDTLLCLRELAPVVLTEGDERMSEAVAQSNIDPIAAVYTVEARTPDNKAAMVNVTPLFLDDVAALRPIDAAGGNTFGGWTTSKAEYQKKKSIMTDIFAGEQSISVLSELSYGMTVSFLGMFDLWKDKPQSIVTSRTIRVVSDQTPPLRVCDRRIGLCGKRITQFSEKQQEAKNEYYACRRSIVDEKGVVQPIVFYVDNTFEPLYYQAIKRGILMWNAAFEKLGYRNVIQVSSYRPDWEMVDDDQYRNCVRRVATSNTEIHTESRFDPRSGEILGTTLLVPFNYAATVRRQLMLGMAAAEPEVRTLYAPEQQVAAVLTAQIARRIGASLGVMPNYAASSAYPTDSLRSPTFTRQYGISASITDDVCCNLVAQMGDKELGVKLISDTLGVYDYLVVEWLYKSVPHAKTPQQERAALDSLLHGKEGDPRYFYAPYEAGKYDPRIGAEDLGDDLFKSVAYQLTNLKYVARTGNGWLAVQDGDYKLREELFLDMVSRLHRLSSQLLRYIGGVYYHPVYGTSTQAAYVAVPREMQRRALREVLDLATDLSWADRQKVSENIFDRIQASEGLQLRIVKALLQKMMSLDLAVAKADEPYTSMDMSDDLVAYFEQALRSREPMSDYLCTLQRGLLQVVVKEMKIKEKNAESLSGQNSLNVRGGVAALSQEIRQVDFSIAQPLQPREGDLSAAYDYQAPRVIPTYREHLYYEMLLHMKTMYNRGATTAPVAATRHFCRYMADRIERALEVK